MNTATLIKQVREAAARLRSNPTPGTVRDAADYLDACAKELEGKASRSAPIRRAPPPSDEGIVMAALRGLAERSRPGTLHHARDLRAASKLPKARFDKAAMALSKRREITLHHHDFPSSLKPSERDALIYDATTGVYYIGAALRG